MREKYQFDAGTFCYFMFANIIYFISRTRQELIPPLEKPHIWSNYATATQLTECAEVTWDQWDQVISSEVYWDARKVK